MIEDYEISFVVQGLVTKDINLCLSSIRRYFPNSEIILSTWKNIDTKYFFDCDALILNEDPGTYRALNNKDEYFNLDRQNSKLFF